MSMVKGFIRILLEVIAYFVSLFIPTRRSSITHIDKDDKILSKPATVLARAIRSGELKSEQVIEAFIAQIAVVNPIINAVVHERFDEALKKAREIDAILERVRTNPEDKAHQQKHKNLLQSPLLGIPFTVKETIALEGSPFTAGLRSRRQQKATYSNPAVEKLIQQGLIPIASTNTPCMNIWYDSFNLLYGRTLNPYDLSRIPGGSSGGEGAILAASGSCLGVGSDLAGSIRIPANFCGVFGHKPTPRTINVKGLYPAAKNQALDLCGIGPMARFACDLKPALDLMLTGEGARAKMRLDEPVDLRKVKIFYCNDLGDPFVSRCDSEIEKALQAAVQHLKTAYHCETQQVTLEEFKYGMLLWKAEVEGCLLYFPEASEGLVRYNPLAQFSKWLVGMNEIPLAAIVCTLLEKLGAPENSPKHLHVRAKAEKLRERFNNMVGQDGVLIMPAFTEVAPQHQMSFFKFLNIAYTAVVNVLHAPVTQCPVAKSKSGMPIGLQLIASKYNDRLTLAVACELDKAFKGWQPAPK